MNIKLNAVELKECNDYFELFSSKNVCKYMDIITFETLNDSNKFLKYSIKQIKNKKSLRFTIKSDNLMIGTVCIYSIDWSQKRASVGFALKENYWNKGIIKYVLNELINICKYNIGINRLQATVLKENLASKKALFKAGFEYEGLLKQYELWPKMGFVDLEIYSIIIGLNG